MEHGPKPRALRWASLFIIVGGLLMVTVWIVHTSVHGPTSYDQVRPILGRDTLFWGSMLGGPPNLLVAMGLLILYPLLARGASRLTQTGYVLVLVGLIVPATIDLYIAALGPPFFVPLQALGLILLAVGSRGNPRMSRAQCSVLLAIGVLLAVAFAWALVPLDVSDSVGGYRLYGLLAHLAAGIGWVVFGMTAWRSPVRAVAILA